MKALQRVLAGGVAIATASALGGAPVRLGPMSSPAEPDGPTTAIRAATYTRTLPTAPRRPVSPDPARATSPVPAAAPSTASAAAFAPVGVAGIPTTALAAYQRAAAVMDSADPGCHLPWTLLAAIGRVESDHGRYAGSSLGADGIARPAILGPVLDGRGPFSAVPDTDAGALDGNRRWDRAVGPMQFLPATWRVVGIDGDGDGARNPQDIDDAALAAGVYLCGTGGHLDRQAELAAAVHRYNPSDRYVALVLQVQHDYASGAGVVPPVPGDELPRLQLPHLTRTSPPAAPPGHRVVAGDPLRVRRPSTPADRADRRHHRTHATRVPGTGEPAAPTTGPDTADHGDQGGQDGQAGQTGTAAEPTGPTTAQPPTPSATPGATDGRTDQTDPAGPADPGQSPTGSPTAPSSPASQDPGSTPPTDPPPTDPPTGQPTDPPTDQPTSDPTATTLTGTWADCGKATDGTPAYCLDGVTLDLGTAAQRAGTAPADLDGDGTVETLEAELAGLVGREVSAEVEPAEPAATGVARVRAVNGTPLPAAADPSGAADPGSGAS